jgi:hypothetical protein
MIKNRAIIIICCLLWLLMAWLIVVNDIISVIKFYPLMTLIYILILAQVFGRRIGKFIKNYDENLYKKLTYLNPMVDNFAVLGFIFSRSDDIVMQKVKNTGKLLYGVLTILFISMIFVGVLS